MEEKQYSEPGDPGPVPGEGETTEGPSGTEEPAETEAEPEEEPAE